MARKVFYSFHYENDINRTMVVRNRWVTQGTQTVSGVIDRAEFEAIKSRGDQAVYNWIDKQLEDTSVTVVLLGANTLDRPFVKYEIYESIRRGNAIIGVHINNIKDMITLSTTSKGDIYTSIGSYSDGSSIIFNNIAGAIYDYSFNDGYSNLGIWVEKAAQEHNK